MEDKPSKFWGYREVKGGHDLVRVPHDIRLSVHKLGMKFVAIDEHLKLLQLGGGAYGIFEGFILLPSGAFFAARGGRIQYESSLFISHLSILTPAEIRILGDNRGRVIQTLAEAKDLNRNFELLGDIALYPKSSGALPISVAQTAA